MPGLSACLPAHAASWALLIFTAGTALSAALERYFEPGQGSQQFLTLDLGAAFAAAAVVSQLLAAPQTRPALTRTDHTVLVVCALPWLLPESHAVYLGMTLAGAWLVIGRSRQRLLREIGQIWLALSLCELWSKVAFKIFYHAIEPFEVGLITRVGRLVFPGLRVIGANLSTHPSWSVVMLEGCSAFHNLSLVALVWLCVLKIAGRRLDPGTLIALAASAGFVIAINVARILAMLPSPDAYHFWHDDTGSVAVALVSMAATVVPVVVYIERSHCAGRSP